MLQFSYDQVETNSFHPFRILTYLPTDKNGSKATNQPSNDPITLFIKLTQPLTNLSPPLIFSNED